MSNLERLAKLDRFFVQQKLTPLVNSYRVSTVAEGDAEGDPLLYVKQRRMKIREQIDIFEDEGQTRLALRLKKRSVLELSGRADVQLADGTVIGQLQKVFGASLARSTWEIRDSTGEKVTAWAQESSQAIAIVRRLWGLLPVVGDFPCPIPFHFDINVEQRNVGKFRRLPALVDRYILDLDGDAERSLDRRVMVAFAIALDALQDR